MANACINSEEINVLKVCQQYVDELKQDHYKSYLSESKDLVKLWNKLLINTFIKNEVTSRANIDGLISSGTSEISLPVKEIQLLKNIPQNLRRSSFFKELNKKMETFMSENEKTNLIQKQTVDEQSETDLNKRNLDNFSYHLNGDNLQTVVEFSCGKEYGDNIGNKIVTVSRTEYSNSFSDTGENFNKKGVGEPLIDIKKQPSFDERFSMVPHKLFNCRTNKPQCISYVSGVSLNDYMFLNQRSVGCNMEKATFFETDTNPDGVEVNKYSTEQNEIYETGLSDGSNITINDGIKRNVLSSTKSKINKWKQFDSKRGNRQKNFKKPALPRSFRNAISYENIPPSVMKLKTFECENSKSVPCIELTNDLRCLYSSSMRSFRTAKIKNISSYFDYMKNSRTKNPYKLSLKGRRFDKKIDKIAGKNIPNRKKLQWKILNISNDPIRQNINSKVSTRNELITSLYSKSLGNNFKKTDSAFVQKLISKDLKSIRTEDLKEWCFSKQSKLCYSASENSFPSYSGDLDQNITDSNDKMCKGHESPMAGESSFSKVQLENEQKLKIIHDNAMNLHCIDSLCVNVPLDFNKYGQTGEKTAPLRNKVIKGIPVFPVDKDFRSFARFSNMFQLKEEVFEDSSRNIEFINEKEVSEERNDKKIGVNVNYCFPLSVTKCKEINDEAEENYETGRTKYIQNEGSLISRVTGNEIVFESIVEVKANEEVDDEETSSLKKNNEKSCSEKLHEDLLNNIYRSASIKIKRTKNKFKASEKDKSILSINNNSKVKTDNGFDFMLRFAIENMEEEYLKKDILRISGMESLKYTDYRKGRRTKLETRSEPILNRRVSSVEVKEHRLKNIDCNALSNFTAMSSLITSPNVKKQVSCKEAVVAPDLQPDTNVQQHPDSLPKVCDDAGAFSFKGITQEEKDIFKKNYIYNSFETERHEGYGVMISNTIEQEDNSSTKEKKKVTWEDDDNSIRIYATPEKEVSMNKVYPSYFSEVNPENSKTGMFQTFYKPKTTEKYDTINKSTSKDYKEIPQESKRNSIQEKSFKQRYYCSKKQWESCAFNRKLNGNIHTIGNTKSSSGNFNVKILDGKIIVFKSPEGSNHNFELPRKTSFWGSMLKQTAKLVNRKFFTFHGTKINLEALGDSFTK